ncbi:MAG: hypothetical protein HQ557_00425 [Bacteroidetes bacterium]|nr:hypothetical protein [Bacteroidota bacterium]
MNYLASEKNRQAEWKLSTKYLSRPARKSGLYRNKLYQWALPVTHADENLQESIRDEAIDYFRRNRISWHMAAQNVGPTNHLCSSQVMCINSMFPFIHNPEMLHSFLEPIFPDIQKILPIESNGQYIAFEWIGPVNYLHEEPKLGTIRHRGLGNTSIDFAILTQSPTQKKRMILGEWKYTESYPKANIRYRSDSSDRLKTYLPFLEDKNCPFNISKLNSLDSLFYEPIYQATRHILRAHEIKKHHPEIDEVIVLHMRTERNRAILKNPSPGLPEGDTVYDSIRGLLHDPRTLIDVPYEETFKIYHETEKSREAAYLASRYRL